MGNLRARWERKLHGKPDARRRTVKFWRTRRDSRVRDDHVSLEGLAVHVDALFPTPDTGRIWGPPQAYNCRCRLEIVTLERDLTYTDDGYVRLPVPPSRFSNVKHPATNGESSVPGSPIGLHRVRHAHVLATLRTHQGSLTYLRDDPNPSSVVKSARELLTIAREAVDLWLSRNAFQHAGALAFYTLFSMAPLLIILTTIVGVVYGEEAASGEITGQIANVLGRQAAEAVTEAVRRSRTEEAGLLPTFLGIGALLFGATTLFAQMQSSLNQFWGVRSKPSRSSILEFLRTRLVSLSLVLILGFLLLVSFAATLAVSAMVEYANDRIPVPAVAVTGIDLATSLGIATLLFATIFKVLPDVHLRWSDMWRGALVTGLLFVLGQYLISLYLTSAAPASPYGAAGALVLILLWVYYSALILFIGAAITRAWIRHRGDYIRPKATAVKVRIEFLEEGELGQMERVNAVD